MSSLRLATARGVEVPLMTLLDASAGELDRLTGLLEMKSPALLGLVSFLLNPTYRNISHQGGEEREPLLYGSVWECATRNFGKGFVLATLGTKMLDLFPVLLRGDLRRAREVVLLPVHIKNGLAFGLFVAVFNTTLFVATGEACAGACTRSMEKRRKRIGWLAGLLAGASVGFAPKYARVFAAQLTLTRSLEVGARWIHREWTGGSPNDASIEHLDTVLMMAGSTVVLNDWLNGAHNLTRNYSKFLNVHGGQPKHIVDTISKQINGSLVDAQGCRQSACQVLHPEEESCTIHWGKFLVAAFCGRSVPMYARVFAIPVIFGLMQGRDARKSILHFVKSVAQSSSFLALYCTGAWVSVCVSNDWPQAVKDKLRPAFTGLVSGAALLAEKKNRRIEVALYVLTHAISTVVTSMKRRGVHIPSHLDTLVNMICCSFLLHEFVNEQCDDKKPKIIRPAYRFLLERFLDSGTDRHATIVPSMVRRSIGSMNKLG